MTVTSAEGSEPPALRRLVDLPLPSPTAGQLLRAGIVPDGTPAGIDLMIRAARTVGYGRRRRIAGGALDPPQSAPPRTGPLAIVGHVQHPDHWRGGIGTVLDAIVRRRPESSESHRASAPAVVHVRRGDYVALGWQLDADYYRRSVARLVEGGFDGSRGLLIVGDDRIAAVGLASILRRDGWSIATDSPHPGHQRSTSIIDDFWSIAEAPAVVMSNSTFCWWATAAGDHLHETRPVVYPIGWTGGVPDVLKMDGWIGIEGTLSG